MQLEHFLVGTGSVATVLLHGYLGSGRNLRSLATAWSAKEPSRVFLLTDLTGHGESPPLPPDASLSSMAADVLETARSAGLVGPLDLVGHSMGGRVSLAAVMLDPASVSRVSLLDITPGPIATAKSEVGAVLQVLLAAPDRAADRKAMRLALTEGGLSGGLSDWLLMNLVSGDGAVHWRFDRARLSEAHAVLNQEDLWPGVEQDRVPTRSVRGGRGGYVSEADVLRMEAAGCPVLTLPGSGHFVHVDAPEALLAWLLSR